MAAAACRTSRISFSRLSQKLRRKFTSLMPVKVCCTHALVAPSAVLTTPWHDHQESRILTTPGRSTHTHMGTMMTATGWSGRSPVSQGASLLPWPLAPVPLPPPPGCPLAPPALPPRGSACPCFVALALSGFCRLYCRPAACSRLASS